MPTKIYNPYDVIVVPFPFTDKTTAKRRPAVVLSSTVTFNNVTGHVVCAMITTAKHSAWPHDIPLTDLDATGLSFDSVVRFKLFTLDQVLILRKIGALGQKDQKVLKQRMKQVFLQT